MKHTYLNAILLAASSALLSSTAFAQQLLNNPGFEFDGLPAQICDEQGTKYPTNSGLISRNWDSNNCWIQHPGTVVAFSLEPGRTGGQSQTITTNSTTGDAVLSSYVTLSPGNRYTAKIWMRADRATDVQLQLRTWDQPYTAYGSLVARVGTTWQEYTFDGMAPHVAGTVGGGLFVLPLGAAKVWLDDASVVGTPDTTQALNTRSTPLPRNYFGMHVHRDPAWPAVGQAMGSERFWDAVGAQWSSIYRNGPSNPDWTKFDQRLNRAIANGAEVVMTLGGNVPTWAAADPSGSLGCKKYDDGDTGFPASDQIWQDWVRAIATRAKGKIKHWEIWNEPYQCGTIDANLPKLVKMVADARTILKQIDPNNVVLSPSFDLGEKVFLERYLQAAKSAYPNGEAYGDIISVHAYDNFVGKYLNDTVQKDYNRSNSLEKMFDQEHLVLNVRSVLARYGIGNKPIWNTEGGYLDAASSSGGFNDAAGIPFIARHMLLGWAAGLDRNFYYAWDQQGLVVAGARETSANSGVYQPTAVAKSLEQLSKWTVGAILSKPDTSSGLYVMKVMRGPSTSYIVWNPSATTSLTFAPPPQLSKKTDLSGVLSTVSGNTPVSASPVLFSAPSTSITLNVSNVAVWQGWNLKVTLDATISSGSSPSGYVQFMIGGNKLGAPVLLSNGRAVLQTTDIDDYAKGVYPLTAQYLGDQYNPPNTSPASQIKVCTALGSCP